MVITTVERKKVAVAPFTTQRKATRKLYYQQILSPNYDMGLVSVNLTLPDVL